MMIKNISIKLIKFFFTFFNSRFRPVPLALTFTGIRAASRMKQMEDMDRVTYEKALHFIDRGHQVIFILIDTESFYYI